MAWNEMWNAGADVGMYQDVGNGKCLVEGKVIRVR